MSEKDCGHQSDVKRKRIRRFLSGLLIFLFIVLLAVLITWAILQPTKPQFIIQDATVFAFNLSAANLLTAVFQITVKSRNNNNNIAIYYDTLDAYAVYRDQQITLPTSFPPTFEDTNQQNIWSPFIYGYDVPISPYVGASLGQDRSNGEVTLMIRMDGRLRWKVGSFVTGPYRIHVYCPACITFGTASTDFLVANNGVKYQLGGGCGVSV
ncbi:hypothetical protein Nepgr_024992 [Nepenthes gracilis]|uniref:Late embryogenesis abundant protein LEA-2 subgroup domain-containing protein n=1 Tax=Nepenthes gracilis TaxID=150966 RepID=A0AAD3T638_NEPGR|nr:hypothetical protein Nepgr_024992 [Nepenthes gracilis]